MFAAMLAAMRIYRLQRGSMTIVTHRRLRLREIGEILRLGTPLAAMLALEYWAFATSTLWAGRLGAIELAAHAIALNLASIAYMAGLGASLAATTRVGNLIGARQLAAAERAAWVSFALGAGAMLLFAAIFVSGRWVIPGWYTPDPVVIALAASLMPIAALFQLFDGLQVVGGGILRGMGRTRPAAAFNLIGYYVLGLPIAAWLGRPERLGLAGIWWGLAAGLFVVGVLAVAWVQRAAVRPEDRDAAGELKRERGGPEKKKGRRIAPPARNLGKRTSRTSSGDRAGSCAARSPSAASRRLRRRACRPRSPGRR
jgi:MATE family multidrug resistance protein